MACRVHSCKSFTQGGRSGDTINQTCKLHDPPSIVLMQRYQIYPSTNKCHIQGEYSHDEVIQGDKDDGNFGTKNLSAI